MADVKGILARKIGMTQVFDEDGHAVPVTLVEAGPCRVAQVKTTESDGYAAIQLAFGTPKRTNKPLAGHYAKAGVEPGRYLVELRLDDVGEYSLGAEIKADVFEAGEIVDVVGVTKGKGFAGPMKRHNFKGLSASHGTQRKHRSPGSIGACATPAARLQRNSHGRSHGPPARNHAESACHQGRRRAKPAAHPRRRARPPWGSGDGALLGSRPS